jgi:hypothetical protein
LDGIQRGAWKRCEWGDKKAMMICERYIETRVTVINGEDAGAVITYPPGNFCN